MADFREEILNALGEIKGSGSFAVSGSRPFAFPGLEIQGMDQIGFPINASQAKEMIAAAHKAPFGKGSKTVLDATVRSAWEIDAKDISFKNKDWGKFITGIIEKTKPVLGITEHAVTANLYKLLIYEKGDFFVNHKDSEKEKGMFGSLVICLPSKHTGGELIVRFDGRTETLDLSAAGNENQISYAAFYADCDHEIKPVTSGYRVCLVYNLIQSPGKEKIQLDTMGHHVTKLAGILKTAEEDKEPKIVLLGHQYTPANFSWEELKLDDRPRAKALVQAAKTAGFYAKLCLVTSYQMGQLETYGGGYRRSRRSYYDDDYGDPENGTMGEVYEEYTVIEHWVDDGPPPLRNFKFAEDDLISPITINEGEPDEKNAEGYTGNAGMEMEYWYHYGAIVLWPMKYHQDVLMGLGPDNKLEWIAYYNKNWNTLAPDQIELAKQLADSCSLANVWDKNSDFNPVVNLLVNLNNQEYLSAMAKAFLVPHFGQIALDAWEKLFESFPYSRFEELFATVSGSGKLATVNHILEILKRLWTKKACQPFVSHQMDLLPDCLNALILSDSDEQARAKGILRNVLALAKGRAGDATWLKNMASAFTRLITREYVNNVLMAVVLELGEETPITNQIIAVCKEDLARRVHDKPQPPADWSRPVPASASNKDIWEILKDFLHSPILQVFNYQAHQGLRNRMEDAIRYTTVDLTMETIKKGSPHTLRLTKTQAAYERELAKWETDVALLGKAEKW